MLLPCTEKAKKIVYNFEKELNRWFVDNFDTGLFIATGLCECSADSFDGKESKSYRNIFLSLGKEISEKKLKRYSAEEIILLNSREVFDNERECTVCGRSDRLVYDEKAESYICSICDSLSKLSDYILDGEFFTVINEKDENFPSVILPFGKYLTYDSRESLFKRISEDKRYVRSYCKNKKYSGLKLSEKLWIGDYFTEKKLENLADKSMGIRRIAVFRADVDNLGHAFTNVFDDKYIALPRTSELSKKLSMFFKLHINSVMKNRVYSLDPGKSGGREGGYYLFRRR